MAKEPAYHRPHVPPEETSINVRRQVPERPGSDGGDDVAPDHIDPNEEPGNIPDVVETGPVFDRVEEPPPTFYSEEMDPDAQSDDADDVEVRHPGRKAL